MNDLPDLPRVLNKKEADVTPAIREWVDENWKNSYGLEIKIRGKTLKPHQARSLEQIRLGSFSVKLSDATIGKQPLDCIGLKNADPLLAIYDTVTKSFELINQKDGSSRTIDL